MNQQHDILLAHDHAKLDHILEQVFESLNEGDHRKAFLNLDYFWALLAVHIRAEHLHLFPILLRKANKLQSVESVGDTPFNLADTVSSLRRDHDFFVKEIGKDVNRLRTGKNANDDNRKLEEIVRNLAVVAQRLTDHNEIEEKNVYPLAQILLTADEITDLKISIARELANIPPRFRHALPNDTAVMTNPKYGDIEGFVLAGGASRRMGEPKYKLEIGGMTFIERAVSALWPATTGQISIVGEIDEAYLNIHLPAGNNRRLVKIPDINIETKSGEIIGVKGALIGLYTALSTAESEWIAVVACDLPFVTSVLVSRLAAYCSVEYDAVVPIQPDGQWQPLSGFYRRERTVPMIKQLIADGDLRVQNFISRLKTRFVEFAEIADLDGSADFFLNVNKPEDYNTALRIADGTTPANRLAAKIQKRP